MERNEKFMESLWQTDPPSRDEPQECSAEKYGSDAKTIVASVFCLTAFKCNNGKDCNETYSLVPYLYTTCTRQGPYGVPLVSVQNGFEVKEKKCR